MTRPRAFWAILLSAHLALWAVPTGPAQPSEALVFDGRGRDLYHVNLITGDRTLISGTRWNRPELLLGEEAGTALILDVMMGMLDRVDPVLDAVNTVAAPPSAEGLFNTTALVFRDATHVLAAGSPESALVEIDLLTGARQVLSAVGVGDGPTTRRITALAVQDPNHALVTHILYRRDSGEPWSDGLYSVDLTTGDWTPLVLAEPVSEDDQVLNFVDPREILPGAGGQVTLLESAPPSLTLLDTGGGPLFDISLLTDGEGTPLVFPVAGVPRDAQSLWVLDHELEGIWTVNTTTGVRTLVSRAGERGAGPGLDHPRDLALAPGGTALWVLTGRESQSLVEVDPVTGDRQVIFEANVGEGPLLSVGPQDLVMRGSDAVLALANGGAALVEVDLATGDRTPLLGFQPPLRRIASGPGQSVWGIRGLEVVRLHLDPPTVARAVSPDNFWFVSHPFLDVEQYAPRQLLLSSDDLGGQTALWEVDPMATPPTVTGIFEDPITDPHTLDHLDHLDEDQYVFVDSARDRYSPRPRPGIFRFTRGESELIAVSTQETPGIPMPRPRQLVVDEVDNIWIVNVDESPSLLRVDPDTGQRTEISGPGRGAGPLWQTATTLVLIDGLPPAPMLDPLLQHLLGKISLLGEDFEAADADDSGDLDAADVVLHVGP